MSHVCHLTSVHPVYDIRIFYKECVGLASSGFKLSLIAPTEKYENKLGVDILPIQLPKSRVKRMWVVSRRMKRLALNVNANLYHFHDPELLLCGVLLKLSGKKVVFDIHENVRLSFVNKHWLPKWLTWLVQFFYYLIESFSIRFFDALVFAEESYQNYYRKKANQVVLNYPILDELPNVGQSAKEETNFVYTGGISVDRGIWEMLHLINYLNKKNIKARLSLVGQSWDVKLEEEINEYLLENHLQKSVDVTGRVDYTQVQHYLKKADIGLALLHPIANYKESLPTKIFEYMQFGLPVITNNFSLYKTYVEANRTGLCVDINDMEHNQSMIEDLISNKTLMKEFGLNGQKVVSEKYNWSNELDKLVRLYKKLL